MRRLYFDTSTVVKRHTPEIGSAWVKGLHDPKAGYTIFTSELTMAEVAAALAAKHRAPGGIALKERDDALDLFLNECRSRYQLASAGRPIIDRAVALTQIHRLRGYDAIQLATALVTNDVLKAGDGVELMLVSADNDLLAAAKAEGLGVDNPNLHP